MHLHTPIKDERTYLEHFFCYILSLHMKNSINLEQTSPWRVKILPKSELSRVLEARDWRMSHLTISWFPEVHLDLLGKITVNIPFTPFHVIKKGFSVHSRFSESRKHLGPFKSVYYTDRAFCLQGERQVK